MITLYNLARSVNRSGVVAAVFHHHIPQTGFLICGLRFYFVYDRQQLLRFNVFRAI